MKATGIVRKMDNLGRVCIPKDICRSLNIGREDALEILVDGEGIYLRKFDKAGDMEQVLDNLERVVREKDYWLEGDQLEELLVHIRQMRQIVQE